MTIRVRRWVCTFGLVACGFCVARALDSVAHHDNLGAGGALLVLASTLFLWCAPVPAGGR